MNTLHVESEGPTSRQQAMSEKKVFYDKRVIHFTILHVAPMYLTYWLMCNNVSFRSIKVIDIYLGILPVLFVHVPQLFYPFIF